MKNYLISYDLIGGQPITSYQNLRNAITKVAYWSKPLESVFIIKSDLTAIDIARRLQPLMHSNDKLLVIEIGKDWGSLNLKPEVVNWLRANL
ncbi:TPA: hypothetical protein DIC38_00450 [Candidatus Nomurabacteria bacterium]|nr:MAG: hypothetical protein O210_OD1C00001G0639 [Parcubacteria bacterium RAAC4_OD1_1]HCY26143.1 hypothetical protein [Candidatus Nomurabacteria bacterium]